MHCLPFTMSNQYLSDVAKTLPRMIHNKHDQNVRQGKIYYTEGF